MKLRSFLKDPSLQVEQTPTETEELALGLLEASFEGLFIHGEGIILDLNQAMINLFGYERFELIGKNFHEFLTPEYCTLVLEKILSGYDQPYEAMGVRKDGSTFPIKIQNKLITHQRYDFRIAAVRDITEHKLAEKAWRQHTSQLNLLNHMSHLFQACRAEEEMYSAVSTACKLLFPDDSGGLYIMNEAHTRLGKVASWGNHPPETLIFDVGDCQALQSGRIYVMKQPDRPVCSHIRHSPENGYLCMPVRTAGKVLGILYVRFGPWRPEVFNEYRGFIHSHTDRTRAIESKRMVATRIASHYAVSLMNLRLWESLEMEHRRSEELLLNILPAPIAEQLKTDKHTIADNFAEVTILFADIVGFTILSSQMPPAKLVELLNEIFSAFDRLVEKHGLEKIKTIGDAYMVVGGLPAPRPDHAEAIAEMALDMQQAIRDFNVRHGMTLNLRIGINTGPVVAGVIGTKKYIYDLWGDAVNIASHMESHALDGCIQTTTETYKRLHGKYLLAKRGTIMVKGKGNMETYFLLERKT